MDPAALQDWPAIIVQAVAHVLRPFFAFNQHNSLLFWPFLVSALAVSLLSFAFARHSFRRGFLKEYRQSYGPVVSRLLISPAQHQTRHSTQPRHWGRNIGFALAIWDGLFGTLHIPDLRERFTMGLGDGSEPPFHGVWRLYWQPVRELWRRRRHGPQALDSGLERPGPRPG